MRGRRRRRGASTAHAAGVVTAALALACTPGQETAPSEPGAANSVNELSDAPPSAGDAPRATTGTATPRPTKSPEPTTPPRPVTISFAGDIHFEGELRDRLDDPTSALGPVVAQLSAADLTVVNLETSIGTSGTPAPKRYTFQAPSAALDALGAAGVDVATMANNHGVDFGPGGLDETLTAAAQARAADPPLAVIGIGADADQAFAPARRRIGESTVAVLGASVPDDPTADPTAQWAATEARGGIATALDPGRLVQAVRKARADADIVVVYLHWGVQGERCPSPSQADLAANLAAAGADVVVGSHAHRLQGAGLLSDTYVAYGLGNFAWYTQSPDTSATGILTLTVGRDGVIDDTWTPARIQDNGVPAIVSGADASALTSDFTALRDCARLAPLDSR